MSRPEEREHDRQMAERAAVVSDENGLNVTALAIRRLIARDKKRDDYDAMSQTFDVIFCDCKGHRVFREELCKKCGRLEFSSNVERSNESRE